MLDSHALAQYMEETGGQFKPWLLLQLRLKKLQERQADMDPAEYMRALEDLHKDLMKLGKWWNGQEKQVFDENP